MEGAILAANMSTKPLNPDEWIGLLSNDSINAENKRQIIRHLESQYNLLLRSEYSVIEVVGEQIQEMAYGFMSVWGIVEESWSEVQTSDGTMRMLSALLTTMMLAIDEQETQSQMRESGIDSPPNLSELLPNLDTMIIEVSLAADEANTGAKSQSVNPYKEIGRNDPCVCSSGKKFKQCCGK
ncbi:SEC-C metal-binding domain-containing protein [Aliivibrio kagoshimensis]|uniref:SEC-C metal-binding domain-containing protein n=1 Tax=Aliivibrio kagoshimensis TaxID=2910230 RepID=UPI003D110339